MMGTLLFRLPAPGPASPLAADGESGVTASRRLAPVPPPASIAIQPRCRYAPVTQQPAGIVPLHDWHRPMSFRAILSMAWSSSSSGNVTTRFGASRFQRGQLPLVLPLQPLTRSPRVTQPDQRRRDRPAARHTGGPDRVPLRQPLAARRDRRVGRRAPATSRSITSSTRTRASGFTAYSRHDVVAAARDLLGQDRAPHAQHRDRVRRRAGDQEGRERVDVAGQLEREDDAR